ARETTVRVAAGAVAKIMLKQLGINVVGYVKEFAGIKAKEIDELTIEERRDISEESPVRDLDKDVEQEMMDAIDQAKADGDSIGGVCEVYVEGMPAGIGSYVHYDRKLDSNLGAAVMSINALTGEEIGLSFEAARKNGSEVHDEIIWNEEDGFSRQTN